MSGHADLTVVTLNYNQGLYLRRNVESVREQGRRLRHIIVDPGSTDGSDRLYQESWARHLQVIRRPDSGPPEGLNNGFRAVVTTFGAFLNADDYVLPRWTERVLGALSGGADLVMGSVEMRDDTGRLLKILHPDPPWPRYMLSGLNYVTQPGSAFRMSAFRRVDGFNELNKVNWDHELFVRMALAGLRVRRLPHRLAVFTYGGTSISAGPTRRDDERRENARIRSQLGVKRLPCPQLDPSRRLISRAFNLGRTADLVHPRRTGASGRPQR